VISTRLPDEPDPIEESPAHVTVIRREQLERSGARTLQDLLAYEAGVVVYDQVGNDIEKTFDLRGFTGGTGTRVFLDGAPINDTRNNSVALDLVPLAALERVEITRGSVAALAGGGSEAGVIHLQTRQGEGFGGSLGLAAGSYDTTSLTGDLRGRRGRFSFLLAGLAEETDGFRENAGGDRRQWTATAGLDLDADRRLELSLVNSASDLGNPGAVARDEDPSMAPNNAVDFADRRHGQASLNFRGGLVGPFTIATNLFVRSREDEILTTGRSAQIFGGFFVGLDASAVGSTVQVTHNHRAGTAENHLTMGVEWLDGETDALGFFTPPDDLTSVDPADPDSSNTAGRRTWALFLQNSWRPGERVRVTAGVRLDDDRVEYREILPDPTLRDSVHFDELSIRAGVTWNPTRRHGFYASYGEGFLPPTAEQLFAFPLFGSNDELVPEDSTSFELGLRGDYGRQFRLQLAVLRVDTENEIIFDPAAGDFGQNINAGETRRDGIEVALRGRPIDDLGVFANLTLMDAEFTGSPNRGNDVPLVPRERLAAGVDLDLPHGLALRTDLLYVGEQVLDGDGLNEREKLDAYTVVNARLMWSAARASAVADSRGAFSLFAEARNLFDEKYATRGIFVDFLDADFFTPAPGRRYLFGVEWRI
jgi:iron complex outermembrane receptor protein